MAMPKSITWLLALILLHGMAVAQNDIPLLRPEESAAVNQQTAAFNQALLPVLTTAAKSTVRVWAGNRRLAYGTVIGDGHQILTKWSEVARQSANLRVEGAAGEVLPAQVSGVYADEDLAVLNTSGSALTPVQWTQTTPTLGGFLAAPQPDGQAAAFGVVSVPERNLRDSDQAFIGVIGTMDFAGPGVKIQQVIPNSGAAAAGLKPGNIILQVGTRKISGLLELKHALTGLPPGSTVTMLAQTDGREQTFTIKLANRPLLPNFTGDRLRQMEHMGGPISQVRDSFTHAIQSDMRPQPDQIGGPVVDLHGRVVGITLARADRTRAFIMPATAVTKLLATKSQPPALATVRQGDEAAAVSVRERSRQNRQQGTGIRHQRRVRECIQIQYPQQHGETCGLAAHG